MADELKINRGAAYRPLPDERVRAAEYRVFWITGKLILIILIPVLTLFIAGIVFAAGHWLWWLYLIPLTLVFFLFKPGFPAFCRCPQCRKKMITRSIPGRVRGSIQRYLVCKECMLSIFLGESYPEAGD